MRKTIQIYRISHLGQTGFPQACGKGLSDSQNPKYGQGKKMCTTPPRYSLFLSKYERPTVRDNICTGYITKADTQVHIGVYPRLKKIQNN